MLLQDADGGDELHLLVHERRGQRAQDLGPVGAGAGSQVKRGLTLRRLGDLAA